MRFDLGVVITACEGRQENLRRVLECVAAQDDPPLEVVVVYDGCDRFDGLPIMELNSEFLTHVIPKHSPGQEQPRNVGVRLLSDDVNYVHFIDSDLIFHSDLTATYRGALELGPDRIMIGPYEWLGIGRTDMDEGLKNDPRWASMDESGPEVVHVGSLGPALGCFGGNLVWPLDGFKEIGGFSPQLWHGRCEDGELGLRAASAQVPMSYVRDARAWHVAHPVDVNAAQSKNARDVPLLNAAHPWVQDQGMILTEADGARFDWHCAECDLLINSHDFWNHTSQHRTGEPFTYNDPASVRPA